MKVVVLLLLLAVLSCAAQIMPLMSRRGRHLHKARMGMKPVIAANGEVADEDVVGFATILKIVGVDDNNDIGLTSEFTSDDVADDIDFDSIDAVVDVVDVDDNDGVALVLQYYSILYCNYVCTVVYSCCLLSGESGIRRRNY
jgi:hypothetical protein